MRYQAEMLAQILRVAQAKAEALVQALPESQVHLEGPAVLLLQEVQAVLRQAVALQQLAALQQEPEALLLEQEVPLQESALVQAEAQVEVLEPEQVQELVQAPPLVEDWVGWVQVEKE